MGDQPEAIKELTDGLRRGEKSQVLLGVTGSGKTFTVANVVANVNKPTLILSHNKTLAAQLYEEMKSFFPNNAVEYYVSYYDYYQPEAYLPATDTYIEKELDINDEIDKLRLSTVSALLSGRNDVVVVSSVSCIYGMGGPMAIQSNVIKLAKGQTMNRNEFLRRLVGALYVRNDLEFKRGCFRVKGDTVDVAMAYSDDVLRITWWDDEIESIEELNAVTLHRLAQFEEYAIYPANIFVTSKEQTQIAIRQIREDLAQRLDYFEQKGQHEYATRLRNRVEYDAEMLEELGYCGGIENYSRYFDGRVEGDRPYCLLDFFPKDFLMIVDESHVSVPQISAMYGGDHARKHNLIEFGFRLPAAADNRPLKFDEFYSMLNQVIYVSATPANFELEESGGIVVEQVVRPTGLLEPEIEVRPSENQIDDLLIEIVKRVKCKERTLVTTLTKRMAEEITKFLTERNISTAYIHSDVANLDRVKIINNLRSGIYDVLVGVNLLREGLDLPEVSLVAILDADKEGFLRSHRSLTQTAGRAARNINGKVIMYADTITESMEQTINETARRRAKQLKYNAEHNIKPMPLSTTIKGTLSSGSFIPSRKCPRKRTADSDMPLSTIPKVDKNTLFEYPYFEDRVSFAADPIIRSMTRSQLERSIEATKELMREAAVRMDFLQASQYRDELIRLESELRLK